MRQRTKRIFAALGIGVGVIVSIGHLILDLVGVRYGMIGMILIVDETKGFQRLCRITISMIANTFTRIIMKVRIGKRICREVCYILLMAICLSPCYLVVVNSAKKNSDIIARPLAYAADVLESKIYMFAQKFMIMVLLGEW